VNAVVIDDVVIGEPAIGAICAFVKSRWRVPARGLVCGVPARVVRAPREDELTTKVEATNRYRELAASCLSTLR
jgi:carbonic anhydrase/acetyltransferase-like protein (isoleucine patch superfamily)